MSSRERGIERDDLAELLDLLRRSDSRTGAVRHREIELGLDGLRRQRHGLLELANRRRRIGRRQCGAEIRARVRVVGRDPHGLAERGNAAGIVARLNQHEAEIVVGFGVFRAKADRLAEFRGHVARCPRPFCPSTRPRMLCASAFAGIRRQRLAKPCDRGIPIGRGTRRRREVQSGLELPERLGGLARARRNVIARST